MISGHLLSTATSRQSGMSSSFKASWCYDSLDYRYSAFQVVSSYTNTGMSLVDQSMLPFQTAYPMIVLMIILILAGNTAFVSVCPALLSCYSFFN